MLPVKNYFCCQYERNNDPKSMNHKVYRNEIETQQHVFEECPRLHTNEESKTTETEYLSEETTN